VNILASIVSKLDKVNLTVLPALESMPEKADLATTEGDYGLATLAEPAGAIVE
jgi:hypothetical protein